MFSDIFCGCSLVSLLQMVCLKELCSKNKTKQKNSDWIWSECWGYMLHDKAVAQKLVLSFKANDSNTVKHRDSEVNFSVSATPFSTTGKWM